MKLLHNYVLVKLRQYESETVTGGGIIIPKTVAQETANGTMKSVVDENANYQPIGEVVLLSDKAKEDLKYVDCGSIVRVQRAALSNMHQYYVDVSTPVQEGWEGYVLIPSGLIESVLDI